MPLTLGTTNVTKLLHEKYQRATPGWIVLLQVPVEHAPKVNVESITILQELGFRGIYISLSRDYPEISAHLRGQGVDMEKLTFIDGVSEMYGVEKVDSPYVTYVASPLSFSGIMDAVRENVVTHSADKKFVLLDSITTVLLYNSLSRTMEFSNVLTTFLRQAGVTGMVVSVSKGFANEKLLRELSKVADEAIHLQ
jgi:KaiC/GvpD/RAD55 family RecA-like ATPase